MITPLDIENKKFGKQMMNGYSVEEVDDFLNEIASDYTKKQKELLEANKKIEELNNEITIKEQALDDLKKQFDIYKAKMESLLISQLELLKEVNKDN